MSFGSLGLCDELLNTVAEQGYTKPTAIQTEAMPLVLSQRDVLAVAPTGTGKTAAFTLPIVQLLSGRPDPQPLQVQALVITPTRELAAQIEKSIQTYGGKMNVRSAAVFGGVRIEPQITQLQSGLHVLVATPGRLIDLYNQQAILFDQLEILVLDEADRMLDMGFIDAIQQVQTLLPVSRQTLMFSATFSDEIKLLAEGMLKEAVSIDVTASNRHAEPVKQKMHPVDKERKSELLIHLIKRNKWRQVLVFSRTKVGADSLVTELENTGISAASIHANRTQHARTRALEGFRSGDVVVLVATDIASRGIDVDHLPCVVNYDLPYSPEDYVHRIGRTGRAGSSGLAVSLFSESETKQLESIEKLIDRQFEREVIPGFKPTVKAAAHSSDDEEYGNFEPDAKPQRQGKMKGQGGHNGNSPNKNRNKWKELGGKNGW